jgi:hypothetical protein
LASGRVELSRLDGSAFIQTRTVRLLVRKHATYPLVSNAARVRTALIHRPDGDPTGPINRLVGSGLTGYVDFKFISLNHSQ